MKFLIVSVVLQAAFVTVTLGYPLAEIQNFSSNRKHTHFENGNAAQDMMARASEQQRPEESRFGSGKFIDRDQSFYPSFSPFRPLLNSRQFFYNQEGAYSQRPAPPFQQLNYDGYKGDNNYNAPQPAASTHELLGSGNFGVLRGGTFFQDSDGDASNYNQQPYNEYYQNGHGRPSFYYGGIPNPRPQPQEQFANFRDFADINTPAYSQYVVVYANKNGSRADTSVKHLHQPKNIMERLEMLDLEASTTTTTVTPPTKKLSKSKRKLAKLLPEKKIRIKPEKKNVPPTDLYEPLIALS